MSTFLSDRFPDPDRVSMLRHHPLGMFLYNLRFLVFSVSFISLGICALWGWIAHLEQFFWLVWASLVVVWLGGGLFTLGLHPSFRLTLDNWALQVGSDSFPAAFRRYFLFDTLLIITVFTFGRLLRLVRPEYGFDAFCWLLLANSIVYTGYDLSTTPRRYKFVLLLPVLVGLLFVLDFRSSHIPIGFIITFQAAPIAAACFLSLVVVYAITRARRLDAARVDEYIAILGDVGALLAPPDFGTTAQRRQSDDTDFRDEDFHQRVLEALQRVCSHKHLWFRSACLWLVEHHNDRGDVLLPAAYHNIELGAHASGIDASSGFLTSSEPHLVRSLSLSATTPELQTMWRFRVDEDVPAALVPILVRGQRVGVLIFYGDSLGVPVVSTDRTFLQSLAATVGNALGQWETFLHALALDRLDVLFGCDTIGELLDSAVTLFKRCLAARGCMIVFRPDPAAVKMTVTAADGFASSLLGSEYSAGEGLTGRCAVSGDTIRIDDVDLHRDQFDSRLLRRMERAHGRSVRSWMAIPIGYAGKNYGVIKAVNATYPCKWFTTYDERLGKDIALRLVVMIEKNLYLKNALEAKLAAQRSATDATSSAAQAVANQRIAEETASRRQQDIMTVMHQLQAPLLAISNALTAVDWAAIDAFNGDMVKYATALVEDAINLGFGTVTVFAKESGRATMFQESEIDATRELEGLARRLQRTQAREDLVFIFKESPGFPRLRIDAAVFASVFYSLIHNAMKYADDNSEVILECSFEKRRPALKVKTIGEPIEASERELVFDKFVRGRRVEHGKRYKGVGLGLWVARGLMIMLGGSLTLELSPEHPKLSVFVVTIPGADR